MFLAFQIGFNEPLLSYGFVLKESVPWAFGKKLQVKPSMPKFPHLAKSQHFLQRGWQLQAILSKVSLWRQHLPAAPRSWTRMPVDNTAKALKYAFQCSETCSGPH